MSTEPGYEEDAMCNRNGCRGAIKLHPIEGCSCHINPPCNACTAPRAYCEACYWQEADDPIEFAFNDHIVKEDRKTGVWVSMELRPLDPSKIDWHSRGHTHSSMIKEGVYPEGATQAEVRARVDGTFGGRFERFGFGQFKFIAYTD